MTRLSWSAAHLSMIVLVLKQEAILPVAQKGKPRFDDQPVFGESAIGAEPFDLAYMSMKRS